MAKKKTPEETSNYPKTGAGNSESRNFQNRAGQSGDFQNGTRESGNFQSRTSQSRDFQDRTCESGNF